MRDEHAGEGLTPPHGPLLPELQGRRRWTPGRIALQALGLAIGLGLLAWAVGLSLSEENARSIEAMSRARWSEVAAILALTLASIVLNGLMFWVVLRPVKRLPAIDVILTNSIATFLSVLPFKLSLVSRVLIHHRRDGVPMRTLVGWVAAMGALGLASLSPPMIASLWRGRMDALWWAVAAGGIIFGGVMAVALGRMALTQRWLKILSLGSYDLVRHIGGVAGHTILRLLDVAVLAARFLAAAAIVDHSMSVQQAVLLSTTYFLLSVLTPTGTLGFREMGVAGLALAQGLDEKAVALIALVVTGAEVLTSGAAAAGAFVRLRPDRLLLLRKPA